MSSSKDIKKEDLSKLEDQAYFELLQIIAEATQYQDINLLDYRIQSWKNKYKKLLDMPSSASKSSFKKRIEYLLNQYYSSITKYILDQLKIKEEKAIQNQSKALRELYLTIKNTNDYDLLKKKIKKWEDKYPISGFLDMYQKRIKSYTREKNLEQNSFKQEEAFRDLVYVTKKTGTFDELKYELNRWEDKYSINNKFTIYDFIKHQSEVKRFVSDEFLMSIAREELEPDNTDELIEEYNNRSYSNLSVQNSAVKALLSIPISYNNVNEMFNWVYKNRNIKFNDKYKDLILKTVYLSYSPTYLNKLPKPKIDTSSNSLTFEEFTNIDDIKTYAIISYFNLLLPTNKQTSNDFFNRYIQVIYSKSQKAKTFNNIIEDKPTPIEDMINSGVEIPLTLHNQTINITPLDEKPMTLQQDLSDEDEPLQTDINNSTDTTKSMQINSNQLINEIAQTQIDVKDLSTEDASLQKNAENSSNENDSLQKDSTTKTNMPLHTELSKEESLEKRASNKIFESVQQNNKSQVLQNDDLGLVQDDKVVQPTKEETIVKNGVPKLTDKTVPKPINESSIDKEDTIVSKESMQDEDIYETDISYDNTCALSPLFFSYIYEYTELIDNTNDAVIDYIKTEPEKENENNLEPNIFIEKNL